MSSDANQVIFLAGASRGVGREIAQLLVQQNRPIKALLRTETTRAELAAMQIETVIGDALNLPEVMAALQAPIAAVISTIGGVSPAGKRSDYLGNKNLIDAAVKAGVKQFILISSIGSGDSVVALPPQALAALKPALIEKEQAENHLINSGLTYTIIRPGGLKSEPATGNGILTENYQSSGIIHRPDVAQLVCKCLFAEAAYGKIFSALDRNMMYGNTEVVEAKF